MPIEEKYINSKGKRDDIHATDAERQGCEVWSRVMGYHRPTSQWNEGKQQEHEERKPFKEPNGK